MFPSRKLDRRIFFFFFLWSSIATAQDSGCLAVEVSAEMYIFIAVYNCDGVTVSTWNINTELMSWTKITDFYSGEYSSPRHEKLGCVFLNLRAGSGCVNETLGQKRFQTIYTEGSLQLDGVKSDRDHRYTKYIAVWLQNGTFECFRHLFWLFCHNYCDKTC